MNPRIQVMPFDPGPELYERFNCEFLHLKDAEQPEALRKYRQHHDPDFYVRSVGCNPSRGAEHALRLYYRIAFDPSSLDPENTAVGPD